MLCAASTALGILCISVHDSVKVLLTGVVAVSRVDDAKHVVSSCLLLSVPVLVDESGSTTPLPQFREHFSLQSTDRCIKVCKRPQGFPCVSKIILDKSKQAKLLWINAVFMRCLVPELMGQLRKNWC